MSAKPLCCHPDAIRCPSLWQRAVRKTRNPWPGSSPSRLFFSGLKLSLGGSVSRRQDSSLLAGKRGLPVPAPPQEATFGSLEIRDLGVRRGCHEIKNQRPLGPIQPTDMFYLVSRVFKKLFLKKIEVQVTEHKMNHSKVYGSGVWYVMLCEHPLSGSKHCHHPRRRLQ